MRVIKLAAAVCALLVLSAPAARANGRFPASNQLVFSPSDPSVVVLRTTFGILVSHDGGGTWHWLCEDVLGISSSSSTDPLLGLTGSGGIVVAPGVTNGVVVSPDTGCNWSPGAGPLSDQLVKDIVVRPDAPDIVLALTSTFGQHAGADGGPGYVQQVYESDDNGNNWAAVGTPIDPEVLATTIEIAAVDPQRIYVSAVRNAGRTASLFVSTDDGANWSERPTPFDPSRETAIYIAAVDPSNPDRVYVRTAGSPSRLLVTSDAGQTFQTALSFNGQMLGFALSPDGSKLYAGSFGQGLFVATREALSFQNVSTVHVQCLATHGSNLWACSDEPSGFIAGASSDDGVHFTARAHLGGEPLIACPADAGATKACGGGTYQAFCEQLGPGCVLDGGDPVARAGPVSTKSCGCSAVGHGRGGAMLAVAVALWAVLARRRARPKLQHPISARGPRGCT